MSLIRSFCREIFIVDDEETARVSLSMLFACEGYPVVTFEDGASFLAAAYIRSPACVLLDLHMPGKSGFEVLKELNTRTYSAPILIMSGHGDIPSAIAAIRAGAYDFIEKRLNFEEVVPRAREAIAAWGAQRHQESSSGGMLSQSYPGFDRLTLRERDVLSEIASAASSKEAAKTLGISPRTVENHRVQIMQKLGAKNTADLVRIVLNGGRGFARRM
jgi:two-component system response regulator FixJ